MPLQRQAPASEDRPVAPPVLLAGGGYHREPSVPNLVVAAARLARLAAVHVDRHFELIAAVAGQPMVRLNLIRRDPRAREPWRVQAGRRRLAVAHGPICP